MTMSLHIKPGDHHASLIHWVVYIPSPIGSCGLVCKIDVAQQILQINCSSLFHEGLHSMFSQSIQSWWCAWCWSQIKWPIPFCFVNSSLVNTLPLSNLELSNVEWVWVTVACELHPLPCSSNSRSAYSVAYLHTDILHTQHLFLSIYNYGCLLDKNRTSFPNSGSCMATRQYFLQGPMLISNMPGCSWEVRGWRNHSWSNPTYVDFAVYSKGARGRWEGKEGEREGLHPMSVPSSESL